MHEYRATGCRADDIEQPVERRGSPGDIEIARELMIRRNYLTRQWQPRPIAADACNTPKIQIVKLTRPALARTLAGVQRDEHEEAANRDDERNRRNDRARLPREEPRAAGNREDKPEEPRDGE